MHALMLPRRSTAEPSIFPAGLPLGDLCGLATRHSADARLFTFSEKILKAMGRLPGLGALRKLTSSLYVDSEPMKRDLGWTPPFTMDEGLRRTLAG